MLIFGMEEAALDYVVRSLVGGKEDRFTLIGYESETGYEVGVIASDDVDVSNFVNDLYKDRLVGSYLDISAEVIWREGDVDEVVRLLGSGLSTLDVSDLELSGLGDVVEGGLDRFFRRSLSVDLLGDTLVIGD